MTSCDEGIDILPDLSETAWIGEDIIILSPILITTTQENIGFNRKCEHPVSSRWAVSGEGR